MTTAPGPSLLMAFDFGLKRIGVAFGNSLTRTTQTLVTIQANDDPQRFERIEALLKEWQPDALVVGVARNTDGSDSRMTASCERFARQLEGRFNLPCFRVDERYTSAVMESCMGGEAARTRKGDVDMGSACLILEQYFLEGR